VQRETLMYKELDRAHIRRRERSHQATEEVAARLIRALDHAGLVRIALLVTWRLTPWGTGRVEITALRANEAAELAERLETFA